MIKALERYPLLSFILYTAAALVVAVLLLTVMLAPPQEDIRLLFAFMGVTGVITIALVYVFHRANLIANFPSIGFAAQASVMLTVGLMFLNVWLTARLMFISEHDLLLVTALLIFAGMMSVAFGFFVTIGLTRRVADLTTAVQELSQGRFKTRLEVQGNDEIAQLSKMFNVMAHSLEQLDEQKRAIEQTRRDLIAWVSHDLRTPLTSMRVMLEALDDGVVEDAETTARYHQNTLAEIQHLSRLIEDLSALALLDAGGIPMQREYTSLHDLISDTVGRMKPQADRAGVMLRGGAKGDLQHVYIDSYKIQRVLYNLVDNAIRYTPKGGEVRLRAVGEEDSVRVDVANSGVYIPEADLPNVFESFYRVEKARAQSEDGRRGTGLGLTIARQFVEAHGGSISVQSNPQIGTIFTFTLPRHPQPAS